MRKIYLTHCSAKKNNAFKETGKMVTPGKLYTATPLQRFIRRCKDTGVDWAIFSDKYGVVFPDDGIEWYEKHPSKVTTDEFQILLDDFISQLSAYDEIWFYHNPGRFHPLYERLVEEARLQGLKVKLFSHISEIEG